MIFLNTSKLLVFNTSNLLVFNAGILFAKCFLLVDKGVLGKGESLSGWALLLKSLQNGGLQNVLKNSILKLIYLDIFMMGMGKMILMDIAALNSSVLNARYYMTNFPQVFCLELNS